VRLVILSGLSGSGKSIALHMLEDLDYYCVDNLPIGLLRAFVDHTVADALPLYARTAVGVDARNHPDEIAGVPEVVRSLHGRVACELIFLTADEDILLKRYAETRRKHPLSGKGLSLRAAIQRERVLLAPIVDASDLIIDTTRTNVHQLREMIRERVDRRAEPRLSLSFTSFAYKHGVPRDADFVFDARALPNPYWDLALRNLTGRDAAVIDFLDRQETVQRMLADLIAFLERWIPEIVRSNRSYLTVAIGCTGGQHRSVYLAEKLAAHFRDSYRLVLTHHNELPG
jgi:RNase adapter protein RapZ